MDSKKGHRIIYELILVTISISALFIMLVWVRTLTIKMTYEYTKNQRRFLELNNEIQQLKATWLELTSPVALDALAKKLGLAPPNLEQVVKYKH